MKETEHKSPIMTSEHSDVQDEESRGRSRGRRRTAREIAQMFEQLKQRHVTRKKEWQSEKEELLKQAALADESKRILVDLKRILEDLRIELRGEENKRREAEEEHVRGRQEWEEERKGLVKIIDNLESQRSGDFSYDKQLINELDLLKTQLLARERDLTATKKSNADLQKKIREQQRSFDEEKHKLLEEHEGEKRNWDRARQVMLEKIDSLRQEKQLRSSTFPLHGSHVASPFTDEQFNFTSPGEKVGASKVETLKENELDETERKEESPTTYNHFQRTVDEALKQIEKISYDLNTIDVNEKPQQSSEGMDSRILQKSPLSFPQSGFKRTRSASLDPSHRYGNTLKVIGGRKWSVSSHDDHSDVSKSPCPSYSCAEQKEISERSNSCFSPEADSSRNAAKSSYQRASPFSQSRRTTRTTDNESPAVSTSPNSCSLPTFTESGTDSPFSNPFVAKSGASKQITVTSSNSDVTKETPFVKMEKNYSRHHDKDKTQGNASATPKKLPNLHQKLLFTSSPTNKSTIKSKETSQDTAPSTTNRSTKTTTTTEALAEEKQMKVHTPYFKPDRGYVKSKMPQSPRLGHGNLPASETKSQKSVAPKLTKTAQSMEKSQSPCDKDFVKEKSAARSKDFITEPHAAKPKINVEDFVATTTATQDKETSSTDDVPPPPVRPKPSVTIEKDAKGNVLRVITDPRFQRQGSPSTDPESTMHEAVRRRRSSGALRDLSPLIPIHTSSTPVKHDECGDKSSKMQPRGNLGTRGKSWIKKRFSFLDSPTKDNEVEGKSVAHETASLIKKTGKTRSKTRSSSLRRGEERRNLLEISTSEESDDTKTRGKWRRRRGRKDQEEKTSDPKSRMKRYTRSKTDSPLEMKNLLTKFRTTQFNSKKPAVLKQFERRLLENEIKTLEDLEEQKKSPDNQKDGLRLNKHVRVNDADDDGYSGEDELEDQHRTANKDDGGKVVASSVELVRTPSMASLQEKRTPPKVFPKPRYHKSMVDLHLSDNVSKCTLVEEEKSQEDTGDSRSSSRRSSDTSQMKRSPQQSSYQYIRTSLPTRQRRTSGEKSLPEENTKQNDFASTLQKFQNKSEFVRSSPSRQSLQERKYYVDRSNEVKRLSVTSGSSTTNADGGTWREKFVSSPVSKHRSKNPSEKQASRRTSTTPSPANTTPVYTSTNVSVISPKPTNSLATTTIPATKEADTVISHTSDKVRNKRRMSEEMQKKTANLERVFKHGPSTTRSRRYLRSETQPIASVTSSGESESETGTRGMTRAQSMSAESFTKEFHDGVPPVLTSRFKKPALTNRRLPSRWTKKT